MLSLSVWMALACVARPAPDQAPAPAPEPAPTAEEAPVQNNAAVQDLHLDWTLARVGDALEIHYSLKNEGAERVYVVDQLYSGTSGPRHAEPARVLVAPSAQPDTVRFVRGVVEPEATTVEFHHPPGATFVDPGKVHEGTATVPLPLAAWHPYAPADPLPASPRLAVLEIATLRGAGEWTAVPLDDGGTLTVPQIGYYMRGVQLVRGEARPLP